MAFGPTTSPMNQERSAGFVSKRWAVAGICLFLAAIVAVVFGQTLGFGFVNYDDNANVYDEPHITGGLTPGGLGWAFTHTQVGRWAPVTVISRLVDCSLYRLWPGGHHLTNLLFHAAAAMILFIALEEMTGARWRSAFIAAIFAIHPLRVESVAWVSARGDVLSSFFFMLTLVAYARHARKPQSTVLNWLVAVLFSLSLMSKSVTAPLPFLLLVLDWWPLNRLETGGDGRKLWSGAKPLIIEKIPLFLLSAIFCAVAFAVQNHSLEEGALISFPWRMANAVVAYAVYILQMFWPAGLSVFYPHPGSALPLWQAGLALLALGGISTASYVLRKSYPWLTVGWVWYLGMLLPVIGIIQAGRQARADRYTYLPQIGLYIIVAWAGSALCARLRRPRWMAGAAAAGAIVTLMIIARTQTSYWHDSGALWTHALACSEENALAHVQLGCVLAQKGQRDEAIAHFRRALEINPDFVQAHYNLGLALQETGQLEQAIAHYQRALEIKPDYVEVQANLAYLLAASPDPRLRDGARAVELARRADRQTGGSNPLVLGVLAAAYAATGHSSELAQTVQREIELAKVQGNSNLATELKAQLDGYIASHPALSSGKEYDNPGNR